MGADNETEPPVADVTDESSTYEDPSSRSSGGPFGPATWPRALVLAAAVAFLAGVIGWQIGGRDDDPFNQADVGFMQDMVVHHDQAVQMSKMLLYKDGIDRDLQGFAEEFLADQRFEQGIFNALLTRFGYPVTNPDETAMGWIDGVPVPAQEMAGMATPEQMEALDHAEGVEAEALFIALMSEHHLGGLHMSDYEVRKGQDAQVRNLARNMLKNQRDEVMDLSRARKRLGLPIPDGFEDPTLDQRLHPLSLNED